MSGKEAGEPASQPANLTELKSPEHLEPGLNFLDQPPFAAILQQVVDSTNIPLESLRKTFLDMALFRRVSKKGEAFVATSQVRELLKDYPYIWEYINSEFEQTTYGRDGSWILPKGKVLGENFPYSDSYTKWVADKNAREKSLISVGIYEVFSEQFGKGRVGHQKK